MSDQIRLTVKDFRAIKDADIKLNGITVVTGENGSGKSTISKLLYHTIKVVNDFDRIIEDQLRSKLQRISSNLRSLLQDYSYLLKDKEPIITEIDEQFALSLEKVSELDYSKIIFLDVVDQVVSLLSEVLLVVKENKPENRIISRIRLRDIDFDNNLRRITQTILNTLPVNKDTDAEISFEMIVERLKSYIDSLYSECNEKKNNRSVDELYKKIYRQFESSGANVDYDIYEYDVPVIDKSIDRLLKLQSVDETIYIDTPMAIGVMNRGRNEHWMDLNRLLMNELSDNKDSISNQIIRGTAYFERKDLFRNRYIYKRIDGKEFNLLECATGVQSFAILQMLLNNGTLDERTLLMIDEPEVHLHPQWIVEYGRYLVLLNKEFGVKILINSHSPDMISAIRYISEKEETTKNLEFYLAEESAESPFMYNFKSLGRDIEPIFKSFNIALDRINQYGISNEDDLF